MPVAFRINWNNDYEHESYPDGDYQCVTVRSRCISLHSTRKEAIECKKDNREVPTIGSQIQVVEVSDELLKEIIEAEKGNGLNRVATVAWFDHYKRGKGYWRRGGYIK